MLEQENTEVAVTRMAKWRGIAEQELQGLVVEAASIRQHIEAAKTSIKKRYFTKKFKKITGRVQELVATLDRLNTQQADMITESLAAPEVLINADAVA